MFGKNLRIIMAYRGVSSAELANKVGVSPTNISLILTGRTKAPRAKTITAMAQALSVTEADFYRNDLVKL